MAWLSKGKKSNNTQVRQPLSRHGSQEEYTFRRSRTLTGTTSSKITPTAESRSQLKTPRLQVHELHQVRSRILKLLVAIIGCMTVLIFLIANYIGTIPILYAQQTHGQPSTSAYRQSVQEYFTQQPLQRFAFLLNTSQLTRFMRAKHSELSDFTTAADWYGGNVRFTIAFRKPILVWQTSTTRFYVDSDGTAFTYDSFGQALVSVDDQSGIAPDNGASVASQRFIKFLGQMVGAVNKGGKGQVSSVIIPASTREIDLKLQGRGYPIKTEIDRDPLQQAEDILNALKYFDAHAITPQYMDVRVAGEAFYK